MRRKTIVRQSRPTVSHAPTRGAARGDGGRSLTSILRFGQRVSPQAVAESTRSLAVLVGAHMPLAEALRAVASQCGDARLQRVLTGICQKVRAGRSLSSSLTDHPRVFGPLYVHLVEVGEAVGSLAPVLRRVAAYLERSRALRRKVRLAMAYPGLIVTVAGGAVGFMLTVVVPTFAEMFEGFGARLPGATQRVIDASRVLTEHAFTISIAVICAMLTVRWILGTKAGKARWERVKLRAPFVGSMLKKERAARFCRTLGTLLERGVPLSQALRLLTRASSNNTVVHGELARMAAAVERGDSLASRLIRSEVFPPLVGQMIAVGEQTARLDGTLLHVADIYEEELDAKVETLTSVIEPLLIIVIGALLGGILIALYLPLFDLVTVVQ